MQQIFLGGDFRRWRIEKHGGAPVGTHAFQHKDRAGAGLEMRRQALAWRNHPFLRGSRQPEIAATRHPFLRGTASTRQASNAVVERWVSAWIIADGLGKFAEAGGDDADARVLGWPEAGTGGIGEDAGVERARKLPLVACASMCPPPITWVLAIPWISGIAGKVGGRRRSCGAGLSMT